MTLAAAIVGTGCSLVFLALIWLGPWYRRRMKTKSRKAEPEWAQTSEWEAFQSKLQEGCTLHAFHSSNRHSEGYVILKDWDVVDVFRT